MKAIVIGGFGGPEVLQYREHPVPAIGAEQVLVRVKAAGVNPVDWKVREGYVAELFPHELPLVPGWDLAGSVEKTGRDVTRFTAGDKVYGYVRLPVVQHGAYAEFAPADADMLAPMPAGLDYPVASTIPLVALTAWQALVDFGALRAGESLFITAGAGGVGGFAIQIAKCLGARVAAAASRSNHDYLQTLGADRAIDYRHTDIGESLKSFAPDGVDMVFDCTGREHVRPNFDYVRKPGGRVATINGLVHTIPELERNADRYGVSAKMVVVEPSGEQLRKITGLIEEGTIKALPVESFPLHDAGLAMEKSRDGHVRGKLALIID